MEAAEITRASDAAVAVASALGLPTDEAVIVHSSNKLALRLLPCDTFARVAIVGQEVAAFEIALAQALARTGSPVAALDARVEPRVHEHDGFAMTFWTYYEGTDGHSMAPSSFAEALHRLHVGMRQVVDLPTPHFTDRVADADEVVRDPARSPELVDDDRALLLDTLRHATRSILATGAPEQLLHGEAHPGNILDTPDGPLFVDLETCCRGSVEFELAHVPDTVSALYPGADGDLVHECRRLVLAMVAAWRWDADDRFPNGPAAGRALTEALRNGPPWPTIDKVWSGLPQ